MGEAVGRLGEEAPVGLQIFDGLAPVLLQMADSIGPVALTPVVEDAKKAVLRSEDGKGWDWCKEDGTRTPLRGDVRFENVDFGYEEGQTILHDVSLYAKPGQKIAFVGSTGAGKTTICKAIMGLLGNAYRADGEILFQAENLLDLPERKRQTIYGKEICLIMQNPMTAFNPSIRVGRQLEKTYLLHHGKTPRQEMQGLFVGILQRLGLEDTQRILNSYPFTLSGGMLQRLMIAAALMCQPSLLVADEATTAIDACNRIGLMRELKSFCKDGMSVLFVTHDLRSASVSDRILVMDRGRIVEQGKTEQILNTPKEDYTKYLLNACRLERREMS